MTIKGESCILFKLLIYLIEEGYKNETGARYLYHFANSLYVDNEQKVAKLVNTFPYEKYSGMSCTIKKWKL